MATKADVAAAAAAAAATPPPAHAEAAPPSAVKAWLPVAVAVLVAPAATWAVVDYVLLPRLETRLQAALSPDAAPLRPADNTGATATKGGEAGRRYEFNNMVVNLAGTMGTRYLKTSFVVTGVDGRLKSTFERDKARLTDTTLTILSSLTLADLDDPVAGKSVVRERLVVAYNQVLGGKVAERVDFIDWVIQ